MFRRLDVDRPDGHTVRRNLSVGIQREAHGPGIHIANSNLQLVEAVGGIANLEGQTIVRARDSGRCIGERSIRQLGFNLILAVQEVSVVVVAVSRIEIISLFQGHGLAVRADAHSEGFIVRGSRSEAAGQLGNIFSRFIKVAVIVQQILDANLVLRCRLGVNIKENLLFANLQNAVLDSQ